MLDFRATRARAFASPLRAFAITLPRYATCLILREYYYVSLPLIADIAITPLITRYCQLRAADYLPLLMPRRHASLFSLFTF